RALVGGQAVRYFHRHQYETRADGGSFVPAQTRDFAAAEELSWSEQRNHNPCVGGSKPSSATRFYFVKSVTCEVTVGSGVAIIMSRLIATCPTEFQGVTLTVGGSTRHTMQHGYSVLTKASCRQARFGIGLCWGPSRS